MLVRNLAHLKTTRLVLAAWLAVATWFPAAAQDGPAGAGRFHGRGLEIIAPLLDRTWIGEDTRPSGERTVSVEHWERTLDGAAARLTACVSDGLRYELTFFTDPASHALRFHAVSNAGPYMTGSVAVVGDRMVWDERVVGSPDLDRIVLTFIRLPGGGMESRSDYSRRGRRIPGGHAFRYRMAPDGSPERCPPSR